MMKSIGLIGLPNSGKSALFNQLTNNRQRVANFPGVTVEKRSGTLNGHSQHEIIDLPGIYTLDVSTLDEKVTKDYIFQKNTADKISFFILVIDATSLKKSLYLASQLNELGVNYVVALNMMDIANQRGQTIDLKLLSEKLGNRKIIPTIATNKSGVTDLAQLITSYEQMRATPFSIPPDFQKKIKEPNYVKDKLQAMDTLLKDIIVDKIRPDSLTSKLDNLFLHPIFGPVILLFVLTFIFQLLFAWADPFMGLIEGFFSWLGLFTSQHLADGLLKSLLVDGVIAGVGGILVFIPHIVFLFFIIYFLEDFGYLGRVAFSLDYLMRKLGLPGRAVVPLLSSHACAIPGIMSARIIQNYRQRMITILIAPLTACSARLPVYTLLIAVIVPNERVFGFLSLPGLVLMGLYLFGIISAFVVAFMAKKMIAPASPSYLLMELPPYRMPSLKNVVKGSVQKGWIFIKKAGTIILVLSILIWGLVTFPKKPMGADKPAIHYSYAASIGKTFEPIFKPLGFDWRLTTALIPSFGARELLVVSLGTVFVSEGADPEDDHYIGNLSHQLSDTYSLATLLSLLIWFVFSPQCISTLAVMKKETDGYKYPLIYLAYTFFLAYFFAWITYLLFS
ncbi:MAG: ferrous iron transporter B [Halobacteriovoraceae bacterium]|jgi:ferrous iron transport protein B|nr:ferrous iron transporter B [Halobacteriovoraceae bacterium]